MRNEGESHSASVFKSFHSYCFLQFQEFLIPFLISPLTQFSFGSVLYNYHEYFFCSAILQLFISTLILCGQRICRKLFHFSQISELIAEKVPKDSSLVFTSWIEFLQMFIRPIGFTLSFSSRVSLFCFVYTAYLFVREEHLNHLLLSGI